MGPGSSSTANLTVRQLRHDSLVARDGWVGRVRDVYFDDDRWTVRHVVVHIGGFGGWLRGRDVLIPPEAIDLRAWNKGILRSDLTREQVRQSPDAESDWPMNRQLELAHAIRLGYPYYWSTPALWGAIDRTPGEPENAARALLRRSNPHLESARALIGWRIETRDAELGELRDFVVDEHVWTIAGIMVRCRAPRRAETLRLAPALVERVDWSQHKLYLHATERSLSSR